MRIHAPATKTAVTMPKGSEKHTQRYAETGIKRFKIATRGFGKSGLFFENIS